MTPIDAQMATLIAAAVAAIASLINLAANIYFSRRANREAQYRELLKPHITQLGDDLYQTIACCRIISRIADKNKDPQKWLERARDACNRVKELHRKLKYPLWGVSDGLRNLTLLANWIDHSQERQKQRDALLLAADNLRLILDGVIREAFISGTPPSIWAQCRVRKASEKFWSIWGHNPEDELENQSEIEESFASSDSDHSLPANNPEKTTASTNSTRK
jgi:hypothetical protein